MSDNIILVVFLAKFLFGMNVKEQKNLVVLRSRWKGWETI